MNFGLIFQHFPPEFSRTYPLYPSIYQFVCLFVANGDNFILGLDSTFQFGFLTVLCIKWPAFIGIVSDFHQVPLWGLFLLAVTQVSSPAAGSDNSCQ